MRMMAAAVLALLLAGGPVDGRAQSAPVVVELVFGLASADGRGVSEQAWEAYVDEILSRNVPGFTVMDCRGGWRADERLEREACKYVVVLTDRAGTPALAAAVDAYKTRFEQNSVLWLERPCAPGACGLR